MSRGKLRSIAGGKGQSGELHDLRSERDVLGCVLFSPNLARQREILELVPDEDWWSDRHRDIAGAMKLVAAKGDIVEPAALYLAMVDSGIAEKHGGPRALGELLDGAGAVSNAELYARIVKEKAKLRRIVDGATRLQAAAAGGFDDVATIAAEVAREAAAPVDEAYVSNAEYVAQYVAQVADGTAKPRLTTGLPKLNERLNGGLQRGWLVVVQAAPKVGKTVLSCNNFLTAICGNVMDPGVALVCSLEMSRDEQYARWFAHETGGYVPVCAQENHNLINAQWAAFNEAADRIAAWKLDVDTQARNVGLIRSAVTRSVKRHGRLDLLVIDGLTQVQNPGYEGNRTADIDVTTRECKSMAVDFNCVVVLNVHVDKVAANGGKPGPYDARGSIGPANDANLLLMPWRDAENPERAGLRIFGRSVAPHDMDLGTLRFDGSRMAFSEAP